jgi:hypothetical protein
VAALMMDKQARAGKPGNVARQDLRILEDTARHAALAAARTIAHARSRTVPRDLITTRALASWTPMRRWERPVTESLRHISRQDKQRPRIKPGPLCSASLLFGRLPLLRPMIRSSNYEQSSA